MRDAGRDRRPDLRRQPRARDLRAGLHFDETTAVGRKDDIEDAVGALAARLGHIAGVLVEPKGLTASVHYRRVRPADRVEVERVVRATIPDDHPNLVVTAGKMVWEVRPKVGWNKGTAVRWIRERLGLRQARDVLPRRRSHG